MFDALCVCGGSSVTLRHSDTPGVCLILLIDQVEVTCVSDNTISLR